MNNHYDRVLIFIPMMLLNTIFSHLCDMVKKKWLKVIVKVSTLYNMFLHTNWIFFSTLALRSQSYALNTHQAMIYYHRGKRSSSRSDLSDFKTWQIQSHDVAAKHGQTYKVLQYKSYAPGRIQTQVLTIIELKVIVTILWCMTQPIPWCNFIPSLDKLSFTFQDGANLTTINFNCNPKSRPECPDMGLWHP